jgi:ParB family chromosome partitioning protein
MTLDAHPSARIALNAGEMAHAAASDLDPNPSSSLHRVSGTKLQQLFSTFKDCLPDLSQLHGVVGMMDANQLAPSRWSCREGDPFYLGTDDDAETQLPDTASNTMPLLIRPWPKGVQEPANFPKARYEVLSGSRRLMALLQSAAKADNASRASTDLDLSSSAEKLMPQVLISVVLLKLDDQQAARLVVHSNQRHRPLRPIEWGYTYKRLLEDQVFKSQKELARVMHRQESEVSRGLALANLDPDVLAAFGSPLDLHYTDGPDLEQAWKDDRDGLIQRAKKAAQHRGQLDRKAVLSILLGTSNQEASIKVPSREIEIEIEGVVYFVISITAAGKMTIKPMREHLCAEAIDVLARTLQAMAEQDHQNLFKPT